jgi:hypothetical protein
MTAGCHTAAEIRFFALCGLRGLGKRGKICRRKRFRAASAGKSLGGTYVFAGSIFAHSRIR